MGVEESQLNLVFRKQENSYTPNLNLTCILEYTRSSLKIYIITSFSMLFLNIFLMLLLFFIYFFFLQFKVFQSMGGFSCIALARTLIAGCALQVLGLEAAWGSLEVLGGCWGSSKGCSHIQRALGKHLLL